MLVLQCIEPLTSSDFQLSLQSHRLKLLCVSWSHRRLFTQQSLLLANHSLVYACVCVRLCVSVSTRAHAGLCPGPDCPPSAKRQSSGRGPPHSASARTRPTLLCGEDPPVYSEDINTGLTLAAFNEYVECEDLWVAKYRNIIQPQQRLV